MVTMLSGARPAGARAAAPRPTVSKLRQKLDELNKKLASLGSYHAQVKDLQIRVIRIQQVLDRLARAAEAPKTLATDLDKLRQRVVELAKRIERVRLDKVRVAYEKAELRAPGGVQAGYDEGFYIAAGNGRYRLQINGILRFTMRGGQVTGTSELTPPSKIHRLGLNVPNGFLQFSGNVFTKKLSYLVELDLGGGQGVRINDLALHLRTCPYFAITAGLTSVGFSQQQIFDPYDTLFVDASPAVLAFMRGRDVGLKLHFYQWKERVFQELGVFNGGGFGTGGNDDVDLMYVARVGLEPLGKMPAVEGDQRTGARPFRFRVAAGYLFNAMPAGRDLDAKDGMDSIFMHQVAAELALIVGGFSFNGELYYRAEDHGKAVTQLPDPEEQHRTALGAFAQASYTFRRYWLQPVVRYTYLEPVAWWSQENNMLAQGWTSPIKGASEFTAGGDVALVPESVHEVNVGLNWFVYHPNLKVMLNYTYLWERGYRLSTVSGKLSRQVHLGTLLLQGRF